MVLSETLSEQLKKICDAINNNKDWGGEKKDAVTYLGSCERVDLERWSTGCPSLDDAVGGGWARGRIIEVYGPESGGKCHAKGTEILMFDGTSKKVEDIEVGDLVMGPDSTSRTVLRLARGREKMCRVTPKEWSNDSFVVNESHILSLRNTETGDHFGNVVNMSITEYTSNSKDYQHYHLYKVPIEFPERDLLVDPYFFGLWLVNASFDTNKRHIRSPCTPVPDHVYDYAKFMGATKGETQTDLDRKLRTLELDYNKRIPHVYKTSSRTQRLELLAGLLDGCNHPTNRYGNRGTSFHSSNKMIFDSVVFLVNSLGISYTIDEHHGTVSFLESEHVLKTYALSIGDCSMIPTRIQRDVDANVFRANLTSSFDIEPLDEDEYYGFFLNGDHLYVMGNFIVQHNTTTCYHAIAEFQKKYPDMPVAFIDTEFTFDPDYASVIGLDVDALILHQPDTGEQALNVCRLLIESGVKLIVVDSVSGLTPRAEIAGDIGDAHIGLQARMMSQTCRILAGECSRQGATIIFTNQIRDKIGVSWGERTVTSGGRALRFYASLRVEIVRIGSEKEGEKIVANKVKATVKKSKVSTPYRKAEFLIAFGTGIDLISSLFDAGVDNKIIKKKGNTFYIDEEKLGVGRGKTIDYLKSRADLQELINQRIESIRSTKFKDVPDDSVTPEVEEQPSEDVVVSEV